MIGGQAVIEGVMMKGPTRIATAVREPSGNIAVRVEPVHSLFPFADDKNINEWN